MENPRLRIGISSCLLGEQVRFDGGHKRDAFLVGTFAEYCEWVPVCPEFELGLGVPRESLRLVGDKAAPRLIAPASETDHTVAMQRFVGRRLRQLEAEGLHGFVFKKGSPTCGLERVRVYHLSMGGHESKGRGLFAAGLVERWPLLPVEEEGRLNDARLRENFIERVFAYYRWRQLLQDRPRTRDLVQFHANHKMTLLSHSPQHYRELGRLVAGAGRRRLEKVLAEYGEGFMHALRLKATPRKHANVLYHLLGFLKKLLDAEDRAELVDRIEAYRKGLVPLVVPLTLLAHHFRRHPTDWVAEQTYLNPYPAELMLRNHV
jgi:uncharacterized protein YbgA (DUF1722 family)/uncharacterized protein YbbK (DUF523 family)